MFVKDYWRSVRSGIDAPSADSASRYVFLFVDLKSVPTCYIENARSSMETTVDIRCDRADQVGLVTPSSLAKRDPGIYLYYIR